MEHTVSKLASEAAQIKDQVSIVLQRLDIIESKMPAETIVTELGLKNAL